MTRIHYHKERTENLIRFRKTINEAINENSDHFISTRDKLQSIKDELQKLLRVETNISFLKEKKKIRKKLRKKILDGKTKNGVDLIVKTVLL